MYKTFLIFSSFKDLWDFKQLSSVGSFVIKPDQHILIGEFGEEEISMALQLFEATIVRQTLETNYKQGNLEARHWKFDICLN